MSNPQPPDSIDILAGWLRKRHLHRPAAFMLEAHQPLVFLAGQACHLASPLLAPWSGRRNWLSEIAVAFSEDRDGPARLLASLGQDSE